MEFLMEKDTEKASLLAYYRERGKEIFANNYTTTKWSKEFDKVVEELKEQIKNDSNLSKRERLECMLMIYYCSYVVRLEYRNKIRPYNYMDFARRIGELYEPFCKIPFEFSLNEEVEIYTPPKFSPFLQERVKGIESLLQHPELPEEIKEQLKKELSPFLELTLAEKLNLKMDLHFKEGRNMYNVDIKSGFNCNEKGYATRLIKTAIAFKEIDPNHQSMMLIRTDEGENNNYLKMMKNSGHWHVYCGNEAYQKIEEHTHYPLKQWIDENMYWQEDLERDTLDHLLKQDPNASSYLKW